MFARVAEPPHAPSTEHVYSLGTSGCLELPINHKVGNLVVSEAMPGDYFGVRLEGVEVERIFTSIRAAVEREFAIVRERSGRSAARTDFGGSVKLKVFTDTLWIGSFPITPTTVDLAQRVCDDEWQSLTDGQVHLVMLLLFGEDILTEG